MTLSRRPRPAKIDYLDFFRALAIFIIVSGHTYAIALAQGAAEAVAPASVLLVLITGGTSYFVFISGFLYRHVFFERLSYQAFMHQKLRNVGVPYLILGVPFALLYMHIGPTQLLIARSGVVEPAPTFNELVFLLSTGRMIGPYWYIPFIMVVFCCSPLFDGFIRASSRVQISVLVAAVIIALFVHRSPFGLDPIQNFFYFVQYYLFGILCAQHRRAFESMIGRPLVIAVSLAVMVTIGVLQVYVVHENSGIAGTPFSPRIDLMIFQKYAGIIFFCGMLLVFGQYLRDTLLYLASISFGIFFVHPIVILVLRLGIGDYLPHVGNTVVDLALYTLLIFGSSVLVVATVKATMGQRSRALLGS